MVPVTGEHALHLFLGAKSAAGRTWRQTAFPYRQQTSSALRRCSSELDSEAVKDGYLLQDSAAVSRPNSGDSGTVSLLSPPLQEPRLAIVLEPLPGCSNERRLGVANERSVGAPINIKGGAKWYARMS